MLLRNTCESLVLCKTFGLRNKDGKFYIGNKEAKIKKNNVIVCDKEYTGTLGLSKLIVAKSPDDKIFTNGNYDNYAEIMHSTNGLTPSVSTIIHHVTLLRS